MSSYRGVTIDRIPHSGMYRAFVERPGCPFQSSVWIQADTLAGIKQFIGDVQTGKVEV